MGKIQDLTQEQQSILGEIGKNSFLQSNFYFTGGTALSSIYLDHRYSEDLDFFSQNKFDNSLIAEIVDEWAEKYGFSVKSTFIEIVFIFNLTFKNGVELKVDFGYYPYKQLEEVTITDGIRVDSLLDIAVNKLFTIGNRTAVKDFVDLYFLLQKFTVWDLIEGVRKKFKRKVDLYILASDFLKVETFNVLPKMIKTLTLKEMRAFFREKAKLLGFSVVEK